MKGWRSTLMERPFNGIVRVIPKDPIVSHYKSSTWCLSKRKFQGCLPLIQILWCLSLKLISMLENWCFGGGGGTLGFCLLTTGDISIKQNSTSKCGTLRVKARPSRPSGNKTVNNFLSSLTTTLQDYMSDY